MASLRHRRFFSLDELNEAIGALLERLNERAFRKLAGSRRSMFEMRERPVRRPLPQKLYVYAEWTKVRVGIDYHVEVEGHYYSVPHQYVREQVDVRLFGGEDAAKGRGTLDGNADALDFHQAYFAVDNLFGTAFRLKVGRQELAYGNQRLVGSVGWSNVGRTFDAAVAAYRTDAVSVDVFTAQLQGSTVNTFSQNLHGLYSTFRLAEAHLADAFVLLDDNRDVVADGPEAGSKKLQRYTLGAYLHGKPAPFDYALEAVYQSGKMALADAQERASIGAYLVSGALGFTVHKAKKLRIGAHYTRLSGDDNPADGAARTFNTLFATNHKFYGFMDYFPRTFSPYGLQDVALSVGLNPTPALGLKVDLHHFASERGIDTTGQQALGQEIDLSVKYKYNDSFSLAAGASFFLADEVMKPVIGNDTASWFYLMSVVNF